MSSPFRMGGRTWGGRYLASFAVLEARFIIPQGEGVRPSSSEQQFENRRVDVTEELNHLLQRSTP